MVFGYTFHADGTIKGEKKHVSYSALDAWKKDKSKYRERYYEGAPAFTSPYTIFGTEVHRKVEHGDIVIPKFPYTEYHHERKVEATLAGVPVLGYIDMCHKDTCAVVDIKTSKDKWTLSMVQSLDQLPLYVAMLREHHDKVSPHTHVIWMETEWVEYAGETIMLGDLELERTVPTSHLALTSRPPVPLERRVTIADVKRVTAWVRDTAREIDSDFTTWRSAR